MKPFLRTGIFFGLPLVAALIAIEARMSAIPNGYAARLQAVDARRTSLEVLVVGSSHEYQGVNTDEFSRTAFNLAMPSQSLTQSAEIVLRYLPDTEAPGAALALPRLRHVLFGIGYYSLPYRMETTNDTRKGFYLRAYRVYGDASRRDLANPFNYLYTGIYGWGAVQMALFTPSVLNYGGPISPAGYSPDAQPDPPDDAGPDYFVQSAASRASFHHGLASAAAARANLDAMRRLAAVCRRAGVTLTLFSAPVTAAYADAFGHDLWLEYRRQIEAFASETGITYTDYSQSPEFSWRDFSDADHLNPRGASKFTQLLTRHLF